jgi:nucleoid DNA-binding protein
VPEFYPDIHDYLENADNSKSVKINHLDDIVLKVRAHTGLSEEAANIVVKRFFQEIRNAMLRGEIVIFRGFGKFFVLSPKVTNSKRKILPKFKPHPQLLMKVNDNRS